MKWYEHCILYWPSNSCKFTFNQDSGFYGSAITDKLKICHRHNDIYVFGGKNSTTDSIPNSIISIEPRIHVECTRAKYFLFLSLPHLIPEHLEPKHEGGSILTFRMFEATLERSDMPAASS